MRGRLFLCLCGPVNAGNWMVIVVRGDQSLKPASRQEVKKSPHAPGTLHVATRIASHRCEVAAPLACADPQPCSRNFSKAS